MHWNSAGSKFCLCRSNCKIWGLGHSKILFGEGSGKPIATSDNSTWLLVSCELKIKESKCWNRMVLTSTTRTVIMHSCDYVWSSFFLWLPGSPLAVPTISSSACIVSCPFTMRSTIVEVRKGFSPSVGTGSRPTTGKEFGLNHPLCVSYVCFSFPYPRKNCACILNASVN